MKGFSKIQPLRGLKRMKMENGFLFCWIFQKDKNIIFDNIFLNISEPLLFDHILKFNTEVLRWAKTMNK